MFPLVPHWDVLSIAWKCSKYRFWVCSNDLVLRTSPLWRFSDFFPNDVLSICPSLYIHTSRQADRQAIVIVQWSINDPWIDLKFHGSPSCLFWCPEHRAPHENCAVSPEPNTRDSGKASPWRRGHAPCGHRRRVAHAVNVMCLWMEIGLKGYEYS